jgi:N-hydroxyarylamine O-acetyltransferase
MSLSIDLDAYFRRIGYSGPREPTLATLRGLHRLHPRAIAFENLDPLTEVTPALDLEGLQAKLVAGGRGGYCFEQNGLFLAVLQALGFEAQGLAARVVWMRPPELAGGRTHMLIRVVLPEGVFLADVGFGGVVLTAPLRFTAGPEQDSGHGVLRLVDVGSGELQLQFRTADGFQPKYVLSELPQTAADYELANWFVATHPSSQFRNNLIVSRVAEDHRLGLLNGDLSIRWKDGRVEKRSLDLDGVCVALTDRFGLPATAVEAARPAIARVMAAAKP